MGLGLGLGLEVRSTWFHLISVDGIIKPMACFQDSPWFVQQSWYSFN